MWAEPETKMAVYFRYPEQTLEKFYCKSVVPMESIHCEEVPKSAYPIRRSGAGAFGNCRERSFWQSVALGSFRQLASQSLPSCLQESP